MSEVTETLTTEQAVEALDAITAGDPEASHGRADDVLLLCVPAEVREAYDRLVEREGGRWWYA